MKKTYVVYVILILCLVLICQHTVYAQSNDLDNRNNMRLELDRLLNLRMDIINDVLYKNEDIDDGIKRLKDIEVGDSFKCDVKALKQIQNVSTDYVFVDKLKIKDINKIEKNNNIFKFTVTISWHICEYEDESFKDYNYCLDVLSQGDRFYINKIVLLEK